MVICCDEALVSVWVGVPAEVAAEVSPVSVTVTVYAAEEPPLGAGFEITLKKRITLRADYRHWAFFDENTGENYKPVQHRRVNARLLLDDEDRSDLDVIPLLRVTRAAGEETPGAVGNAVFDEIPFDDISRFIGVGVAMSRDGAAGRDPRHDGHAAGPLVLL